MRPPAVLTTFAALTLMAACRGGDGAIPTTTATTAPTTTAGPATTTSVPLPPPTVTRSAGCEGVAATGTVVHMVCLRRAGEGPVAAVLTEAPAPSDGVVPVPGIVLWASEPSGWEEIGDLSRLPPGNPVLVAEDSQIVETIDAVDFNGDGTDSLVVAVLRIGASAGPLDLAVFSLRGVDVALDLRVGTVRGGTVVVSGDQVELQAGSYAPGDPGCCPSGIVEQTIGWDPIDKKVTVLSQTITPVTTTT